jgi:aldoxime dehydratase
VTAALESSIAAHLRTERTRPTRKGEAFTPPYPSFSARFAPAVSAVVMAYFGAQYFGEHTPAR